jgi:hypothetical protein
MFTGLLSIAIVFAGARVYGDIVWAFHSTGEGETLSGRLTTSGDLADAAIAGRTFYPISIDTVVYNGTDITDASNWYSGDGSQPPPFSDDPYGSITTVLPYQATITVSDLDTLYASDVTHKNVVRLGRGSDQGGFNTTSFAMSRPEEIFSRITTFQPVSTTFMAIPEPSAFLCMGLICVGALGWTRVVGCWMKR